MLIFTFATAMMVAMLIATVLGLHQDTQRVRIENRIRHRRTGFNRYGERL